MNDNAKKWVAALRSGDYPQGRGVLHGPQGYCCLGVACKLAAAEGLVDVLDDDSEVRYAGYLYYLPTEVQGWLGLSSYTGRFFRGDGSTSLATLNDQSASFDEIADIIESEPKGLFT